MQTFIVEAANRPGELGRIADAIAKRGINVYGCCLSYGNKGGAAFLAQDETALRGVLDGEGFTYHATPVLTIWIEDQPGQLAQTAKRLGDAGVNIELFTPVAFEDHKATVAIGVDKIEDARRVLADQLVQWRVPEGALAGSMNR